MTDMEKSREKVQLQTDILQLNKIAAFYRKMMKEFNVQQRGVGLGPPNYSMTLYFQSHLEDEADFYTRVASVLENRVFELETEDD
ncbi:MAG: hypothetical protein V3T23_01850 [Nitrososphaerales archaeon]